MKCYYCGVATEDKYKEYIIKVHFRDSNNIREFCGVYCFLSKYDIIREEIDLADE